MFSRIVGFSILAAVSMAALAAPGDDADDVRCLIVAAEMSDSKDKDLEEAGSIMTMYYLGKLDGRSPGTDLEALVLRQASGIREDDKERLLIACSAQLELRAKQLQAIGERLSKR